jgi:PAS domain S-box-containing protein
MLAAMQRIHLTLNEWLTTFGAKAAVGISSGVGKLSHALRYARAFALALVDRAKVGGLRLQEVLQERENRLLRLVADSRDPTIVTDNAHRVLDANAAGSALFGVSEANIRNFTIDAFVPSEQAHFFERSGPPFVRGATRQGECEITRLDGKSILVGFSFQPNVILGRHVATFQNVAAAVRQPSLRRNESSASVTTFRPSIFPCDR